MCVGSMQIPHELTSGITASLPWVSLEAPAASLLCVSMDDCVLIKYLLDTIIFPLNVSLIPEPLQYLSTWKFHFSQQTTGPSCQQGKMVKCCQVMKYAGCLPFRQEALPRESPVIQDKFGELENPCESRVRKVSMWASQTLTTICRCFCFKIALDLFIYFLSSASNISADVLTLEYTTSSDALLKVETSHRYRFLISDLTLRYSE